MFHSISWPGSLVSYLVTGPHSGALLCLRKKKHCTPVRQQSVERCWVWPSAFTVLFCLSVYCGVAVAMFCDYYNEWIRRQLCTPVPFTAVRHRTVPGIGLQDILPRLLDTPQELKGYSLISSTSPFAVYDYQQGKIFMQTTSTCS